MATSRGNARNTSGWSPGTNRDDMLMAACLPLPSGARSCSHLSSWCMRSSCTPVCVQNIFYITKYTFLTQITEIQIYICIYIYIYIKWAGWLSRYSDWLRAGWSGIESRWGRDFPPVQTGPGAHPASCKLGTGSVPEVKCGRGVLLTTHPLLVPRSWKSRAIPLPTLWATPGL